MDKSYLENVKRGTMRKGKNELLKHLSGAKIHRAAAIKAKCYDCNGLGESNECSVSTCPLYGFTQWKRIATA